MHESEHEDLTTIMPLPMLLLLLLPPPLSVAA